MEDLIRDVAREERTDVFAKKLFQWDLAVRQFRKIEQRTFILAEPTPTDLEFHALCLHGLLMIGRSLVLESRQFEPEDLARFQVKDDEIEAYVEDLEQSFREWHHGFSKEELEKTRRLLKLGVTP